MKTSPKTSNASCIMPKILASTLALVVGFVFVQLAGAAPISYTWSAGSPGNWSSPGSWAPGTSAAGPTSVDTAIFYDSNESASPATVNNTVDSTRIVGSLIYSNIEPSGSYVYPVTSIPSGNTLTVTNLLMVGGVAQNAASGDVASYAYFVGGGTLNVTAPNLLVTDGGGTSSGHNCAYLYLQGLTNFVYNNPKGFFGVRHQWRGKRRSVQRAI